MRLRLRRGFLTAAVASLTACGAPRQDPGQPARPDAPTAGAQVDGDGAHDDAAPLAPNDVPRPRSEPPPRPAPPPGITALRRDAITLALSGDGQFLAAGDLAGQALLWDLPRGRFVWADPTPEGNRLGRMVFAAGAPIYLGGSFHEPDRPWRFWSADLLERRGELGESGWIGLDAALDDKGTRALTLSSSRDGAQQRLELWDIGKMVVGASPNATPAAALVTVPVARATRGSVALDAVGARFALADELGGVTVMAVAADPTAPPLEVFKTQSEAGTHEDSRVSKLTLSADGATLYGSIGPRLMTWPLTEGGKTSSLVIGASVDAPREVAGHGQPFGPSAGGLDPIRGLHRVTRTDAVTLVVVTRPVAGGLRFYAGDGQPIGRLDTGCRCEIHALSADSKVAACGCVEAAELRWGRVTE